jgi:hypothetical protein
MILLTLLGGATHTGPDDQAPPLGHQHTVGGGLAIIPEPEVPAGGVFGQFVKGVGLPESGRSAEKQPYIGWFRRFPRDGPSLFFTVGDGQLRADEPPEAGSAWVFLLEGDSPSPGMQAHHIDRGIMADALPAYSPDIRSSSGAARLGKGRCCQARGPRTPTGRDSTTAIAARRSRVAR